MAKDIPSKYKTTKADLIRDIRKDTLQISKEPGKGVCYFCVKEIVGQMIVLTREEQVRGNPAPRSYHIHKECYDSARQDIFPTGT